MQYIIIKRCLGPITLMQISILAAPFFLSCCASVLGAKLMIFATGSEPQHFWHPLYFNKHMHILQLKLSWYHFILTNEIDHHTWRSDVQCLGCVTVFAVFLTWVNCFSVRLATRIQDIFTVGKLMALGLIIAVGLLQIYEGMSIVSPRYRSEQWVLCET